MFQSKPFVMSIKRYHSRKMVWFDGRPNRVSYCIQTIVKV